MQVENESNDRIGLRVTAMSAMGMRKYMEDTFTVAYQKSDDGKDLDYAFFGMFDGHGGDTASIFAKNHLMNYIVDEPGFWSTNDQDVLQAIKKGFLECHLAMWKDLDKWPPTNSGLPSTAGTTASVAFLRKGKLYIGHCGDSGIVLGRTNPRGGKWIAQPLTTEHKPESPDELARIESFGGKVQQKQGIHRVVWYRPKNPHQGPIRRNTRIEEVPFLAVARSLGDLWSYNYKTQKFVVSPEPDVQVIDVDIQSFKCLIFASDGLWNVIDADYSVESVYETERRNDQNAKLGISTWRNPSRILVETALEKWRSNGLRADNTSVVCVMLNPPEKRNMYKFCRSSATEHSLIPESQEGARTIFDYSTSEVYNLDYMGSDLYGGEALKRPNASFELHGENQNSFHQHQLASNVDGRHFQFSGFQQNCSSGFNSYETSYGSEIATTSHQYQVQAGSLTYQATNNESAFVKACCRNNYLLASVNEQIPYHSSYEQHREMYENMYKRPYPPLHYAYRPVPASQLQRPLPLPSLQPNIYDHHGYLHSAHNNYKPMERYNYLRPTPEEIAALHNEEDDNDSESDSNAMDFSDEESDEESGTETKESTELESAAASVKVDDSIQIFEITSSSFHNEKTAETDHSNDEAQFKKKPTKSNDKENTERSARKRKVPTIARGRFYATRQTDRKMRSGNVGVSKTIGREKSQRRITRNIRKVVKTLNEAQKISKLPDMSRAKKIVAKTSENKPEVKKARVLRSADTTFKKEPIEEIANVRSLRSNGNVMEKPVSRKRFEVIERLK